MKKLEHILSEDPGERRASYHHRKHKDALRWSQASKAHPSGVGSTQHQNYHPSYTEDPGSLQGGATSGITISPFNQKGHRS
jgi:hypothetical protein